MYHSLTTSPRRTRALMFTLVGLPLLLIGCAAETGTDAAPVEPAPAPADQHKGPAGSDSSSQSAASPGGFDGVATLKIDGTEYTFDLSFCAIDEDDVLMHGPGTSASGDDAYLDGDFVFLDNSWSGELRIDLGITEQFDSSDEFYLFTTHRDGDRLIASVPMMSTFSATGDYWVNGEQTRVTGNLEVDCS